MGYSLTSTLGGEADGVVGRGFGYEDEPMGSEDGGGRARWGRRTDEGDEAMPIREGSQFEGPSLFPVARKGHFFTDLSVSALVVGPMVTRFHAASKGVQLGTIRVGVRSLERENPAGAAGVEASEPHLCGALLAGNRGMGSTEHGEVEVGMRATTVGMDEATGGAMAWASAVGIRA